MIGFDLNPSEPVSWLVLGLLAAVLLLQLWLLIRNQALSPRRKGLRLALNGLFWLALAGFVLKPVWTVIPDTNQALVAGAEVPAAYLRTLKDSLGVTESFREIDFKGQFEAVTLVGQNFSPAFLSRVSQQPLRWVPYHPADVLQSLRWKGLVRQGERQRVTGRLRASEKQWLRLRYAGQTLDSTAVGPGDQTFTLQFPAFGRGRSQAELLLGEQPLDTIRFFTQPVRPLTFRFLLGTPDFETKTLADWRGQQGHRVQLTTTLSRNIGSSLRINAPGAAKGVEPDIVVTDPDNAGSTEVRRALGEGRSVLVLNLSAPETEVAAINRALGSRFRVQKVSNEPTVPVLNGRLTALPYKPVASLSQWVVAAYPVVVQPTGGKIGLSLLGETFPLRLSGDSLTYGRIWGEILAPLQPPVPNLLALNAPLYPGLPVTLRLSQATALPSQIALEADTARLTPSAINAGSGEAVYRFAQAGWHRLADSLEVYVDEPDARQSTERLGRYLLTQSAYPPLHSPGTAWAQRSLPTWVWLGLLLLLLTALWVEPKLG